MVQNCVCELLLCCLKRVILYVQAKAMADKEAAGEAVGATAEATAAPAAQPEAAATAAESPAEGAARCCRLLGLAQIKCGICLLIISVVSPKDLQRRE